MDYFPARRHPTAIADSILPDFRSCWGQRSALLHGEKTAEKRPVAAQCKTEILGRDIIAAIPLALESRSFSREHFSQALHRYGDKIICLLYRLPRLVNKTHLERIPPGAKILRFFGRKQRCRLLVHSPSGCRSGG